MRRLFIIGNGFDLDHKLPTKYEDFHKYLRTAYPDANEEYVCVPVFTVGHHGEDVCDKDEVVGYLMNLISRTDGDIWADFESSLGRLDFDDDFYELTPQYDHDGDRNLWHEAYDNEDLAARLEMCVPYISTLFSEWIDSIDISLVKPNAKFQRLVQPDDIFLNFNYTTVLEQVYRISPSAVCHIHGVQGEELIFGHGEGNRFDEDHASPYIGCEDGLENIQSALRKDTAGAIKQHEQFFQDIPHELQSIYSYGFSFSKVDEEYLKLICSHVDTSKSTWFLNSYALKNNPAIHKKHIQTIIKCGFKGKFDTFTT